MICEKRLNSLSKGFQTPYYSCNRVVNIVGGKGENGGYQHFLPFPQCFQKASSTGSLKPGIV